jgi:hypothetical protein
MMLGVWLGPLGMATPLWRLGCDPAMESVPRHAAWKLAPDGRSFVHINRYTCHASHQGLGCGPFPISSRTAPLAGYSGYSGGWLGVWSAKAALNLSWFARDYPSMGTRLPMTPTVAPEPVDGSKSRAWA